MVSTLPCQGLQYFLKSLLVTGLRRGAAQRDHLAVLPFHMQYRCHKRWALVVKDLSSKLPYWLLSHELQPCARTRYFKKSTLPIHITCLTAKLASRSGFCFLQNNFGHDSRNRSPTTRRHRGPFCSREPVDHRICSIAIPQASILQRKDWRTLSRNRDGLQVFGMSTRTAWGKPLRGSKN